MSTVQQLFDLRDVEFNSMLSLEHSKQSFKYLPSSLRRMFDTVPDRVMLQVLNTGVGVEVEVEHCGGQEVEGFETKPDNSLRNNGLEYVSHRGHRIHTVLSPINKLCEMALAHGWNISDRTSIHVHLNVLNLSESQMQSFIVMYALLEESLFQFISPHRSNNIFCVPLSETENLCHASIADVVHASQKYSAFNLRAVRSYGTVEFRHMQTCYDFETIASWVLILGLLRRYARQVPIEQVKATVLDLKTTSNYMTLMREIFFGFADIIPVSNERMDKLVSFSKMYFFKD